ncbi:alginate biosynthesis protein AlgK [Pseudomonas sp. Gutcm_11s]|uniref:alginate biosynthesis protein AlgK n=1 Tax=Pseudomonas sp. Gutcm_11s TaxID=3026088 RepID=UPI002361F61E|nr:alginate biosynthesis protein AlgK [Pseudomonas sp. Gutcm_11s]MDD0843709.1 alginate biosynthesis protein AlgK [Pseudomonas sp. Gutcm_11s]
MNARLSVIALCVAAAAGCAQLPDMELAKQARTGGDLQTAESNFRSLAELGYEDAEVGLADVLVQSPDPQRQAEGEAIYRRAANDSLIARIKLGKWLAVKENASEAERQEAKSLLRAAIDSGDQSVLLALVRLELAEPQPDFAAVESQLKGWQAQGMPQAKLGWIMLYRARGDYEQHLDEVRQSCETWLNEVGDCYVELATVYRIQGDEDTLKALLARLDGAYASEQVPPAQVKSVARALAGEGSGEPRPEEAKQLYEMIAPQWPDAWAGLADLVRDYPQLGEGEQVVEYLEKGVEAGSSKAAAGLGQVYLNGQLVPAEPDKAEKYLLMAAPQEPKARIMLARLYREGKLGAVEPDKARDQLLIVARSGNPSADVALAQLFGEGRGIRINPVYAYGFATLAKEQGMPQADQWLERIAPRLQPGDMERVRAMVAKEKAARTGEQLSLGSSNNQVRETL